MKFRSSGVPRFLNTWGMERTTWIIIATPSPPGVSSMWSSYLYRRSFSAHFLENTTHIQQWWPLALTVAPQTSSPHAKTVALLHQTDHEDFARKQKTEPAVHFRALHLRKILIFGGKRYRAVQARSMGIHGLMKLIGDYAPSAMKENDIKTYFGRCYEVLRYFFMM